MIKLVIELSRGMIRDQRMRRQTMFYTVLIAVVMLFCGSVFLRDAWHEHPFTFLFYWAACAWMTLLSVLLALFDILMVRAAGRAARKRLEARFIDEAREEMEEDRRP